MGLQMAAPGAKSPVGPYSCSPVVVKATSLLEYRGTKVKIYSRVSSEFIGYPA